GQYRVRFF
ncbi:putative regulatory protein UhpC, partial [Vibrio parahaemolyticus VPTS-2010_2]